MKLIVLARYLTVVALMGILAVNTGCGDDDPVVLKNIATIVASDPVAIEGNQDNSVEFTVSFLAKVSRDVTVTFSVNEPGTGNDGGPEVSDFTISGAISYDPTTRTGTLLVSEDDNDQAIVLTALLDNDTDNEKITVTLTDVTNSHLFGISSTDDASAEIVDDGIAHVPPVFPVETDIMPRVIDFEDESEWCEE